MTPPAWQPGNDSLYFKDPVSCGPPYSLQPFAADIESSKENSIITSLHSTVDRSSTTSVDLGVTEYQPPEANESAGSSPASPHSHSLAVIQPRLIPVLFTEIIEGARDSLETLALMNTIESTATAGTLGKFEEFANTPPGNVPHPKCSEVHRKDGDTPPFRKWMRSFRRKGLKSRVIAYPSIEDTGALKDDDAMSNMPSSKAGTKTSSSSMRFVTAVKTASNTFASLSIAGGSARRKSSGGTLDDATVMRMRDRRCALEELINTEEYYIADLKVLVNVSFCLHVPSCF